ncbi:hypothetical protein K4A81_10885 [Bacillus velezensis]|uniref:hypothetical protein n=1 Tax=Bacillus velezensis TaxID=492670 RepID=UPI001CA3FDF8|nr:hypothetical protein [Bacillus velezensis]QZY39749.1 hypothetical protein K4A81_10885 [Bacillus velezensis]
MAYDEINGKLINPKVSDVIKALQDQFDFNGDTPIEFRINGEETSIEIQLDPYENVLLFHLEES